MPLRALTQLRRPKWHAEIDGSNLEDWQKTQARATMDEIARRFPDPAIRSGVRVLDIGCCPAQDRLLAKHVGHVTGTNLNGMEGEPSDERASFVSSAERRLPFADDAFDFAFSLNVMEHLANTRAMVAEHVRVVRPGGFGYIDWGCIWGCKHGHHVFAELVRTWEQMYGMPHATCFEDDGAVVPDWGHLLLTRNEMRGYLRKRLGGGTKKLIDQIIFTVYDRTDAYGLSRLFLDEVERIVRSFDIEIVDMKKEGVPPPRPLQMALEAKHGDHDFTNNHCTIVFRKPVK